MAGMMDLLLCQTLTGHTVQSFGPWRFLEGIHLVLDFCTWIATFPFVSVASASKKICPFSSNQLVCVQNLTGWHRLLLQLLSRQQFWALKSHIVQRSKEQGVLGLLVLTWLSWSLPLFTFLDLFSHVELLPFTEHYVWTLCWVFYIYNLIVLWLKDFGARFKS